MPFDHSKKNTFEALGIDKKTVSEIEEVLEQILQDKSLDTTAKKLERLLLGGPFNSADGINPLFSMLGNILNNNQSLYSDDEESDEDRDDDEEND
jgi:hypothetical protein